MSAPYPTDLPYDPDGNVAPTPNDPAHPAAGWYPDPDPAGGGVLRLWDGTAWTKRRFPSDAPVVEDSGMGTELFGFFGGSTRDWDSDAASQRGRFAFTEPQPLSTRPRSWLGSANWATVGRWKIPLILVLVVAFLSGRDVGWVAWLWTLAIGLLATVGARWKMVDIPTVEVAGAYVGVCELAGTVEAWGSPVAGWCTDWVGAWTMTTLEEYEHSQRSSQWEDRWSLASSPAPQFTLRGDDGARILVDTTGVDPRSWVPHSLRSEYTSSRRVTEYLLPIGARVLVLGPVQLDPAGHLIVSTQPLAGSPVPAGGTLIPYVGTEHRARRQSAWLAGIGGLLAVAAAAVSAVVTAGPDASPETQVSWALVAAGATVAVLGGGYVLRWWNRAREVKNRFEMAWSLIATAEQYRHDLIPNVLAAAQGAAAYERTTLVELASQATHQVPASGRTPSPAEVATVSARVDADGGARAQILALIEANPELRAEAAFAELFDALVHTENRLAAARRFYNDAVTIARDRVSAMPGALIARPAIGTPPPLLMFDGV